MLKKFNLMITLVILFASSNLDAQIHGLAVTDLATPAGKGSFEVMGTTSHSETISLYGGRIGYGITENFLVFTDLGLLQDDQTDSEDFMAQFGLKYSLPFELPFDLALRSTVIPYKADTEHYIEVTFGFLASKYLDAASKWAVYGGAGVDYQEWELVLDYGGFTYEDIGEQTDLMITSGVSHKLNDMASLFVETVHLDVYYFGGGIKFGF